MKKTFLVVIALVCFLTEAQAEIFKEKANLVLFGGYWAAQANTNNHGHWYGIYADWSPFQSAKGFWTLGPYAVVSKSAFTQNLERYNGKTFEAGGGGALGYYDENYTLKSSLFFGFSLGLKYSCEEGESYTKYARYRYWSRQEDLLLVASMNWNIFKKPLGPNSGVLPRTQVILDFQTPLNSRKSSGWNDSSSSGGVWNKTFFQLLAKQSLATWRIDGLYWSPKLVGVYSYAWGNQEHCYGPGIEIGLNKPFKDDLFIVYFWYKMSDHKGRDSFVFGASLNLASF